MTKKRCCINTCLTPDPRLFKFPSCEVSRDLWLAATEKYLRKKNKKLLHICKKHFAADCIYNDNYTVLVDGKEIEFPRKYPGLKKNSVPSIFEENAENDETNITENAENHSEASDSLTDDNKKSTKKRKRQSKDTQDSKITCENSEQSNHKENPNPSEISVPEYSQFSFTNSCDNDLQSSGVKRLKIDKTVSQSSAYDCDKTKKTKENLKISVSNFPSFIVANSETGNSENRPQMLKLKKTDAPVSKLAIKNVHLKSGTNQLLPIIAGQNGIINQSGSAQPETNKVLKLNIGINQRPTVIATKGGILIPILKQSQNVSAQPTIKKILKLNPGINQSPTVIPNQNKILIQNSQKGSALPANNNILKVNPGTFDNQNSVIESFKPTTDKVLKLNHAPHQSPSMIPTKGGILIPIGKQSSQNVSAQPTTKKILKLNLGVKQSPAVIPSQNKIVNQNGQNGSTLPANNNILKVNPGTFDNQIPSVIESFKPTTDKVLKLNHAPHQSPSMIPLSGLPHYSFAARQKPSSPNCTELLILKKLNQDEKNQLNKVATVIPVPNLNLANNGATNNQAPVNNSTEKLAAGVINSIKGGNVISVNPTNSHQPKVQSANKTVANNNNNNSTSKFLKPCTQRVRNSKHERDLSPESTRRLDIANEIMELNSTIPPEDTFAPALNFLTGDYSKVALMRDWNCRQTDRFPKYWGMIDSPDGVFFGYLGDTSTSISRSIFVKEDMTVELRAHNQIASCPVIEKIGNLEHLRIAMIKIVSMNLCIHSLEGKCKSGFYVKRAGTTSDRCTDCQKSRKKENTNSLNKNKRFSLKQENRKKNLKNLKNRLSRALKKIDTMQNAYEELSLQLLEDQGCNDLNQLDLNLDLNYDLDHDLNHDLNLDI